MITILLMIFACAIVLLILWFAMAFLLVGVGPSNPQVVITKYKMKEKKDDLGFLDKKEK